VKPKERGVSADCLRDMCDPTLLSHSSILLISNIASVDVVRKIALAMIGRRLTDAYLVPSAQVGHKNDTCNLDGNPPTFSKSTHKD
jgi:hypothetical protein